MPMMATTAKLAAMPIQAGIEIFAARLNGRLTTFFVVLADRRQVRDFQFRDINGERAGNDIVQRKHLCAIGITGFAGSNVRGTTVK